jgi:alpha/beta hydrolase fold
MGGHLLKKLAGKVALYAFGFFSLGLYFALSVSGGEFFRKYEEKDKLRYAISKLQETYPYCRQLLTTLPVRDQLWNLNKSPLPGFSHHFFRLRNGLKLHYIANKPRRPQAGNLVIFLHGFPDGCFMWRHLLQEPAIPIQEATIICVDLPGYGGSDSFEKYDTQVLEALTEFIVDMRDTYLSTTTNRLSTTNTYIVGHDWGCVLGFRLASEAPTLADRFILTNAPHVCISLPHPSSYLADLYCRSNLPWPIEIEF